MDRQTGALKEYMGTLIDITERKHASQALLVAQEDFKRASQLIIMGEFAASIAHEINQPITAMVTDAYACLLWLADGKLDVAAARKTAQSIVNEGHRAGEIIKGVYRLAKKHPPELVPFDINHVILDVFVMLRNEIERHEVILQADLCQASTTVFGDSVQIRQVILNILRNAIEAMSSVSGRKRMLHVLSNVDNKDKINVVIQDTGPGLDPSIVDRVFMPFVTTKSEGMGMGLSICQSIIESHGGNLWISQTGISGTIFQFSLPVADASHSLSSVSQSQRDQ